jgi:hypothetical protein
MKKCVLQDFLVVRYYRMFDRRVVKYCRITQYLDIYVLKPRDNVQHSIIMFKYVKCDESILVKVQYMHFLRLKQCL